MLIRPAMAEAARHQAGHSRRYGISDRGVDLHGQGVAELGFRIGLAQWAGQRDSNRVFFASGQYHLRRTRRGRRDILRIRF